MVQPASPQNFANHFLVSRPISVAYNAAGEGMDLKNYIVPDAFFRGAAMDDDPLRCAQESRLKKPKEREKPCW